MFTTLWLDRNVRFNCQFMTVQQGLRNIHYLEEVQ